MNDELIFDYKKEALMFLQGKILHEIYPATKTAGLMGSFTDLDKVVNLIGETKIPVQHVIDTSEILLPKFKYAIKNEDIKILDAILDGMKAAAAANYFQNSPSDKTVSAITGIIAALIKLGRDLLKGVRLNSTELMLLIELKRQNPIETKELLQNMIDKKVQIDEKELLSVLGNLSQKKSLIGTNVALIAKTVDGRWVTMI